MASDNDTNPVSRELRSQLERVFGDLGARGIKVAFAVGGEEWYIYDPANDPNLQISGATEPPHSLPTAIDPHEGHKDVSTAAANRPEKVSLPDSPPESAEMATHKDNGIPKVKFLPKPEGWKGDPGNPNFKTLGTLSPPVMRKIEPAGPHFLAFARRVSHVNQLLCVCL